MKVALYGNVVDSKWMGKIDLLLRSLEEEQVQLSYYDELFYSLSAMEGLHIPKGELFSSSENLPCNVELFLALGGDGTFLHSISLIKDRGIPIAGINFGRLGFLTTAKVSNEKNEWIRRLISGDYELEKRTLLKIDAEYIPKDFYPYSLNEFSIQRKDPTMIGVELKIDGDEIPTFWADGLVVSTPTGSTAYSLSVGGPIVSPGSAVFIIAPIAPHNLNVRPLVVSDESELEIRITARSKEVVVVADNRSFTIPSNGVIRLCKGEYYINDVSFSKSSFFEALKEKLLWGMDKRNR